MPSAGATDMSPLRHAGNRARCGRGRRPDLASGSDSGVLTTGAGLVEAVLPVGALTLTAVTGGTPTSTSVLPLVDQAPPL